VRRFGLTRAQIAVVLSLTERKLELILAEPRGARHRHPRVPPTVRDHHCGASFSAIARALTSEGVPTAHGGAHWWPATIRKVLQGRDARQLAETVVAVTPNLARAASSR